MDAFNNYIHQCPNCEAIIGKSTPDDREAEKKKGKKIAIGLLVLSIIVGPILTFGLFYFGTQAYSIYMENRNNPY